MSHKVNRRIELSKASLRLRRKGGGLAQFNAAVLRASGMKNQKTKRSMSYDQTANDCTNYYTVDPAAHYETKRDKERIEEEIQQRKEFVKNWLIKR